MQESGSVSQGVERQGRETDQTPQSSAAVKNDEAIHLKQRFRHLP
jgi:hypothetical protein